MRMRPFTVLVASVALLAAVAAAACGGDEDAEGTPAPTAVVTMTPAPTATPMTRIPDPIVVTSDGGLPSGGGVASEGAVEYTVEPGDTILGIAERFGVDADVIRQTNDIEGDAIFVGQTLTIPRAGGASDGGGTTEPQPTATATPPPAVGDTYTVQEGDTAFGIALQFDTTVEALAAVNGMTEDEITNLQIGQVIILPRPE